MIGRLKTVLLSIQLFSMLIVGIPLHGYQVAPADAAFDSCLHRKGLEFLWVFPRQSGKDETIAQLVVFLLTLFHRVEAQVVHVYPTAQQITTGLTRLERRLDNKAFSRQWWSKSKPDRRGLGEAFCAFFSGHPLAKAEGATANLLLIVNEIQDQDEVTIERRFTPMRASTNATAIYVGTVRTTHDYLWKTRRRLERLESQDGIQRVFMVTPDQVGAENPHYADFVEAQVRLKGRQHPTVKTELFNEPLDTASGLFPPRRLALMSGSHERQATPGPGEVYVATIDVGGQDEAATLPLWGMESDFGLNNPDRDYTVCTITRVVRKNPSPSPLQGEGGIERQSREAGDFGPVFEVVDLLVDHGSRHFQDLPGRPSLFARLLAYLQHWNVALVICDASGVGQGLTDALTEVYPRQVEGYDFARAHGKARLGNDFLALVETGRFKYFKEPPSPFGSTSTAQRGGAGGEGLDGSDTWWFFTQCRFCTYDLAEGVPIERGLKWEVPAAATVTLDTGETLPVHDDRLLSAALTAHVDAQIREGKFFVATGQSAVINIYDQDQDGEW